MFLHMSDVCHSVHGGCLADTPMGRHTPRQTPLGRHPHGHTPPLGQTPPSPGRQPLGRHLPPPQQTATAADGTHPTGMHSCTKLF